MTNLTFDDVRAAHERIQRRILRSPTVPCEALSKRLDTEVWLKLENLQAISSFKERGAANKLALLTEAERARGVIAVSAGNHAQGVARHAHLLGIDATIVMPRHTPSAKIERTRKWGAHIVAEGEDFAAASLIAEEILEREGRVLVHPFNDLAVMAGQGTFAIELLEDAPPLDYIVLPIGGGGLLSGSAIVTKAISPQTRIIGVQVESYASLASFPEETPAMGGSTIAEGMAVLKLGARCLETVQPLLDCVLIVSELEVEAAVATLAEQARVVSEGAGAAALAAVVKYTEIFEGKRVGLPVTGGNISTRVFANTLLRALRRDGRILFLNMQIPDRPGLLADIARRISEAGGNIIEVSHQRLFAEPSVQSAELEVMIEARDGAHAEIIQHSLAQEYKLTRR